MTPQEKYNLFVEMSKQIAFKIRNSDLTETECGSVVYFLYGKVKSLQSLNIKFGNEYEDMLNEFSKKCGLNIPYRKSYQIGEHQIDTLIIEDGYVEYREQKTNIQLDTEKLKSTIDKINNISNILTETYSEKTIRHFVHNTTVWEEDDAPHNKTHYSKFRNNGVNVLFMKEYFEQLDVDITKDEFYSLFIDIGQIIDGKIDYTNAKTKKNKVLETIM